ncbi:TetR/AcrR family transcriptional regulator [Sphingobium sp. HBC34]|uniref:TetR/AcrR family transcriptional regulator n=1 Tax=Sphingobium cyanobacteriorum TaxID=3063954 RepID=A0ABT8ZG14_9SPHN|nr:TetR/AcrR family transcriptional regulator [Sphingobium sp. HBC34]MDO7833473.1 TetR/AcrR family transcriptional regulator [Sphingobium sp. HBC34]
MSTATTDGRASETGSADGGRRRRRTREDVTGRICDAACQLFAERGYHGATTREIARVADVSETLLFRYYGNKSILFDEVVAQPFNRLMQGFLKQYPNGQDRKIGEHYNFLAVYDLFDKNRSLFLALLSAKGTSSEEDGAPSLDGLLAFFRAATAEQERKYTDRGIQPPFDIGMGLRLAFGMLASTVLLRDWLFPEGAPPQEELIALLECLVRRALDPAPDRDALG